MACICLHFLSSYTHPDKSAKAHLLYSQQETPLEKGITLWKAGQHKEALEALRTAARQAPQDVRTQLWLGLALEATGQPYEAMAAWRAGYGNPVWEPVADYLKALSWWKMNRTTDATAYFKEALVNVKDGKKITFAPATEALQQLQRGAAVPALEQWADLSTLTAARTTPVPATKATTPAPAQTSPAVSNAVKNSVPPGVNPKPGRWKAIVSNGFKGDSFTFTVSADGKRVENLEFSGYWRGTGRRTERLQHLDPPQPFAINQGNFSSVQQNAKSAMWWEAIGRFTSSTTAEGTYRVAFNGGENDTYQLKWTATRQ